MDMEATPTQNCRNMSGVFSRRKKKKQKQKKVFDHELRQNEWRVFSKKKSALDPRRNFIPSEGRRGHQLPELLRRQLRADPGGAPDHHACGEHGTASTARRKARRARRRGQRRGVLLKLVLKKCELEPQITLNKSWSFLSAVQLAAGQTNVPKSQLGRWNQTLKPVLPQL